MNGKKSPSGKKNCTIADRRYTVRRPADAFIADIHRHDNNYGYAYNRTVQTDVPMSIARILLLLLAGFFVTNCVSVRSNHGYILEKDQTSLSAEPGFDTRESILAKFGDPSMTGISGNDTWYYLSSSEISRAFFRPRTTRRTIVAFHFNADGVVESSATFDLDDGNNIGIVSRTTPTRGKELGFWEQLLGNVGQLPSSIGNENQVPGQ